MLRSPNAGHRTEASSKPFRRSLRRLDPIRPAGRRLKLDQQRLGLNHLDVAAGIKARKDVSGDSLGILGSWIVGGDYRYVGFFSDSSSKSSAGTAMVTTSGPEP